ncbi:MAG: ArsR family transcriptional regulator [Candidatus Buchananbacteria bacterium CG10_big_fil_rev_8_21_14_0_10_42_9]|uniref:ArsR family transcriptional regulator n=1 Tax=Candidatus Buchananbacteria bacterium CG10_big_fil_rev_8_21_14_0_10_42_9 TaxID=1974526 RepID=A0A2H0W215_9BACT|nr:MAG: ArsR family transcriptional regulator [Candidatus Buchananbacteria bacterium CG10_big_fil_rev_8_21_14_0_10_42_9]
MQKTRKDISSFILANIEDHSSDIVNVVANTFNVSRQRAHAYITREIKNGKIIKVGRTNSTRYFLVAGNHIEFELKLQQNLAEDQVWIKYLKPMLIKFPESLYGICYYGFTEILNNAIEHSDGSVVYIAVSIKNQKIEMEIMDNGVGIFKKIQDALKLETIRESILHLSKGKFTTDPARHTGEGIFFTSRIFDNFSIFSSNLFYTFRNEDWIHSTERKEDFGKGTFIKMAISTRSKKTAKEVMDKYADAEIGFGKTIVAVALSADPNDPHVSRSQAKRLMMGLEKFRTIVLDFRGVKLVGQAFVDEVFRVFKNAHPHIEIHYLNANKEVKEMIERGKSA